MKEDNGLSSAPNVHFFKRRNSENTNYRPKFLWLTLTTEIQKHKLQWKEQ